MKRGNKLLNNGGRVISVCSTSCRCASASVRAFGGSSLHWGSGDGDYWHACPFDEVDFELGELGIPVPASR